MQNQNIKVLICDDSATNGVRIAAKLGEKGIYAYTRSNTETAMIHSILSDRPDVVVTDLTLADSDAVVVMEKVRPLLSESPAFVIVSDIANSFVERQIIASGASYFLVRPFDMDKLSDVIRTVAKRSVAPGCTDAEMIVTEMIRKAGIPAHIKGYRYVREGALACIAERSLLDSITKRLYPMIAEEYETTPSRVERAIRHAIETAWERGDKNELHDLFGYNAGYFSDRPTNAEFIAMVTDKVRLQLRA